MGVPSKNMDFLHPYYPYPEQEYRDRWWASLSHYERLLFSLKGIAEYMGLPLTIVETYHHTPIDPSLYVNLNLEPE